ncbi:inactive pancreatic lipase-related protein 1-like [Ostrinia nubilalis]|uniref:inactive pancreatic lipase-related protein 1-like n=1 Tax=Ostrinia nubilalis TaxID=29057 RepID=UPI00308269E0
MSIVQANVVWCIVFAILPNVFEQTSGAYLRCYRGSFNNYTEVPLTNPDSLLTARNPCIDKKKWTVIVGNGYNNDVENGPAITTLLTKYSSLGTVNAVLLNWSKESKGIGLLGILNYPTAVTNSLIVAKQLAKAVIRLVELGMSKKIHFVGHSLGAHLLGQAGRETIKQSLTIPRLTGLDPARVGFDPYWAYPPVDTSSAGFVDIIHSDFGGYGLNKSIGHVDIWVNYGLYLQGIRRQPGCNKSYTLEEIGSGGNRCSHDRSWQYYSVSLTSTKLFVAGPACNYCDWLAQNGIFVNVTYIGPKVNLQIKGNSFLTTSDTQPWGKGKNGLVP